MRKIIACALSLVFILSTIPAVSAAPRKYDPIPCDEDNYDLNHPIYADATFTLGDVNDTGTVDGKDSLTLKATVAGLEGYSVNTDAADFDADGDCTAKDSYYLKLVLSGAKSPADFENGYQIYSLTVAKNPISEKNPVA